MTAVKTQPLTNWTIAPLCELIDHIIAKHHSYLRAELPKIEGTLQKVAERHPDGLLAPVWPIFQGLKTELESHMMKEEVILFPHIVNMEAAVEKGSRAPAPPFGSVRNPIRMMEHEHDGALAALEAARRLTNGYTLPPDGCETCAGLFRDLQALEADLREHIHLENDILFPRAVGLEG